MKAARSPSAKSFAKNSHKPEGECMFKIANAPCSWGALEFDLQGKPATYDQVLDEMQETGYLGTELGDWGFMPTDPTRLKAELDQRGLSLVGAFVPVALKDARAHPKGEEAALEVARLLAAVAGSLPFIVLADDNGKDPVRTQNAGRVTPAMSLSDAEWEVFTRGVERIAHAVKEETGLRLVVHPHCAGYCETPTEIARLLSLTDPSLVGLCLDTGHYQFAGGDPLQLLRQFASRVWHIHFKDCHPRVAEQSRQEGWDYFKSVEKGIFCELGNGSVDFPAIKQELEKQGYRDWVVVEQDVLPGMGRPKESAFRNRQYLKSIGL
jgi:inosose dehydratase